MEQQVFDQKLIWALDHCKRANDANASHIYQIGSLSWSDHKEGQRPQGEEHEEASSHKESNEIWIHFCSLLKVSGVGGRLRSDARDFRLE